MAPSFNAASMTLEQAADFVAMRAAVGIDHTGREKQAMGHPLAGALIGGGLGAGVGMLGSMGSDDEDRKRNWWRNALMGGALGAGVGGMAGVGMDLLKPATGVDPEVAAREKLIRDRVAAAKAKEKGVTDPLWDYLSDAYNAATKQEALQTPEDDAFFESKGINAQERARALGATRDSASNTAGALGEYAGRPATVIGSGVAGAGLGHLVDRARAPGLVGTLNEAQLKTLSSTSSSEAVQIQNLLKNPRTVLRSNGITSPTVRMAKPPAWLKQTPPAMHTMSPHLMHEMKSKLTPSTGKWLGGAAGGLFGPGIARIFAD